MDKILQVQNLKKYFPVAAGTLHAVDDVSFDIYQGETLGVVGESGCGKSTLGRVLLHLLEPTSGKMLFKGEDITFVNGPKLSALRKEMQMIFQDPYSSLNPHFTLYQTLSEPLQIAGGYSKAQIDDRVREIMDTVGLEQRLINSYPHELGGGRRQRIGIGRALALKPSFIVCDEPVSALDVSIQAQIINLLLDIQEKQRLTYMFVTHDMMVVRYISDRIMAMYLGQTVEFARTEDLFAKSLHPYTKALLSAVPIPDVDKQQKRIVLKGEVTSPINPKPGCRFAARCSYAQKRCFEETPLLEEVEAGHFVACHLCGEINKDIL